jgi:hypothetical protein
MPKAGESCSKCNYWIKNADKPEGQGDCRRYAPRPGAVAAWPKTPGDAWCGEYKPRKTSP